MKLFQIVCVLFACSIDLGSTINVAGTGAAKSDHTFHVATGHELYTSEAASQPSRRKKDNPFVGVIVGILLWWLVPIVIWNNERIAIKQYKMQFKAEKWAIHIDDAEVKPLEEMDGRICYVSGNSSVHEVLADEWFPQVTSEAIKLRRVVEMYQWVETKNESEDRDGHTSVSYSYSQNWCDCHQEIEHDESKRNPEFPLPSTRRQETGYRMLNSMIGGNGGPCAEAKHENVRLGAYYLGDYVIRELMNWRPTKGITPEQMVLKGSWMQMLSGSGDRLEGTPIQKDEHWYFGNRVGEGIGNVRVSFEELQCGPTSLCGVLAKTETGFTFVPILRADAAGAGDSFWAELGGSATSCCVRVRELHYEEEDDDDFKETLKAMPTELTKKEKKGFHRSATAKEVTEYTAEADIEDLCCVGPCGGAVIKMMHQLGLEEEFLGVAEKDMELRQLMRKENSDAANRHHAARIFGCIGLCCGSNMIISPIIALLNANWLVAALGGALLSAVISCLAMLCSFGCCLCIMSCAWLVHRPFLAVFGFTLCFICFFGMYLILNDPTVLDLVTSNAPTATPPDASAAFLAFRQARQAAHLG